jgi:hypothetical protein
VGAIPRLDGDDRERDAQPEAERQAPGEGSGLNRRVRSTEDDNLTEGLARYRTDRRASPEIPT